MHGYSKWFYLIIIFLMIGINNKIQFSEIKDEWKIYIYKHFEFRDIDYTKNIEIFYEGNNHEFLAANVKLNDSIVLFTKFNNNEAYNLPNDCENFYFNLKYLDNSYCEYEKNKFNKLRLIDSIIVKFPEKLNKSVTIYSLACNFNWICDADYKIFWTKEFGILINKSIIWRNYDRLIGIKNSAKNDIIKILCDSITVNKAFWESEKDNPII